MLYIPVFDSEDVISVPVGPDHAADPEEVPTVRATVHWVDGTRSINHM